MQIKPRAQLTLRDKLSRLSLVQGKKLLGPRAAGLMPKGGAVSIDISAQVLFTEDHFQTTFPQQNEAGQEASPIVVTLSLHPSYRDRLQIACSHEEELGDLYRAATIALILEEKTTLGLAAAPDTMAIPWELVPADEIDRRALAERELRAREEKLTLKAMDKTTPWTDYIVSSALSGKSYRVALRGRERGESYCSCPDFRKNSLGTCKHVLKVIATVEKKFDAAALKKVWKPEGINIHARYDGNFRLGVQHPSRLPTAVAALITPWTGRFASTDADLTALFSLVQDLSTLGENVVVYPDAEEVLNAVMHRNRMASIVSGIRQSPATHPLRTELLRSPLLPYQLDGIAFAAGAGRAILADEMGLGKTMQGIGVAEFLAQQAGIQRVLIVCPASLKSQWKLEIERFCGRSVQLITGSMAERGPSYQNGAFFTVCNYEQVLRDFLDIERTAWDLIILDEAQRIKNWEAKTTRIIKSLRSPFALVLTGTPVENKLDDLFSIAEFIDDRQLGPAYRFIHGHRMASETGKVLGYKNLDALRGRLKPILLRRTRASIMLDLPPRTMEIVRIQATDEQQQMHNAHMQVVQAITSKPFISEMDLLRLQRALLMARMSANSTFLVDKQNPAYSSKLERLTELLTSLILEPDRKIILFSEWTTMLDLIEPVLHSLNAEFVRLDGSVPQKKRQQLVAEFQTNPACRVFITTNAGSTGLNLQSADTVINVDLPWNPALLEQRIARAHRMGQKRKVHVYLMITERTIEENLLATLAAKHELAAAVLDPDSSLREVPLISGMDELKRRLEILLGATPEADPDISTSQRAEAAVAFTAEKQTRVQAATGTLLTSAITLLAEMMPNTKAASSETVDAVAHALQQSMSTSTDGKPQITFTLPDASALQSLASAFAALMQVAKI